MRSAIYNIPKQPINLALKNILRHKTFTIIFSLCFVYVGNVRFIIGLKRCKTEKATHWRPKWSNKILWNCESMKFFIAFVCAEAVKISFMVRQKLKMHVVVNESPHHKIFYHDCSPIRESLLKLRDSPVCFIHQQNFPSMKLYGTN